MISHISENAFDLNVLLRVLFDAQIGQHQYQESLENQTKSQKCGETVNLLIMIIINVVSPSPYSYDIISSLFHIKNTFNTKLSVIKCEHNIQISEFVLEWK